MTDEVRYIDFLPPIFRGRGEDTHFLSEFIKVFEKLLKGRPEEIKNVDAGIEEILDRFSLYMDPYRTPAEMIPWLAGWLALDLMKGDVWEEKDKAVIQKNLQENVLQYLPLPKTSRRITRNRRVIRELGPYTHQRGTKAGLERALEVYLEADIRKHLFDIDLRRLRKNVIAVNELSQLFQLVSHKPATKQREAIKPVAMVGYSTIVGEPRPYYFRVNMGLKDPQSPITAKAEKKIVAEIIDREKPAHTYYTLQVHVPGMQIGKKCTIGKDTLIKGITI